MTDALRADIERLHARVAALEAELADARGRAEAFEREERRARLLLHELNHRVKNTLASVQAIARLTLKPGRSIEDAAELLTSRLIALSGAHDALIRGAWTGAGLREVAEAALRPFAGIAEDRVAIGGDDIRLDARAALAMALALHELATNAAKYGALSGDAGRVALTWVVRRDASGARLELEWRESGGPPVAAPARRGFGSRLLSQGLAAELNGAAELVFEPSGLVCHIAVPLPAASLQEPA